MSAAQPLPYDDEIAVPEAPGIPGLRFRRYRGPADHLGMVRVWNAQAVADGDAERVTVATFDSEFQNLTNCDPATDVAIAEMDGEVISFTQVEWLDQPAGGGRRYDVYGALHPAWRRLRIGTAMLGFGLRRARQIGDEHEAAGATTGRDRWFRSWGADTNDGHIALLQEHGFRPVRHHSLMVRDDLDGIDIPSLPPDIQVRDVLPGQERIIFDASTEAFQDSYWGSDGSTEHFQRWISAPAFDPSLIVVGWAADAVAGGIVCAIDDVENEANDYRRGWVETVFTRARWRHRGIARALLARALLRLRDRGMTSAQLSVDMDNLDRALDLYVDLGFRVEHGTTVWRRDWD